MTATLAHIWRHPVKGLGSEAVTASAVTAHAPLPGDRAWALAHGGAEDTDAWQRRRNFLVVAYGPRLAQITAQSHADGTLTLTHPDQPKLTFAPETDGAALIDWVRPLWPTQHSAPARLVKAPPEGMADNGLAQVSINSLSSLKALSEQIGHTLDPRRFRGNLWIDGWTPWQEFDLIGQTITIGDIRLKITDRIERCRATEANPDTGGRDIDPPRALLDRWGHKDFGVSATILDSGTLSVGDPVGLL
ncbi:MAG: MOSC N-terminal beta barrel domain-containing protein [Pseudomonadota bacterium]